MTAPAARNGRGASTLADLGPEPAHADLPARIEVEGRSYFLVRQEQGYRLLSTVCPHKGGEVADAGSVLECPKHRWRFDRATGECTTTPGARLASFPVELRDGRLVADLPTPFPAAARAASGRRPEGLDIRLHAHACLEIAHDGFSLLTDPWLAGPAFFGSWIQYPAPAVAVEALAPDAIWISHEHSDHFHEPTLERFERSTPVYVPDFPNRRLVERLDALGFEDVRAMPFGEKAEIAPGFSLTCFEPGSLWNDSIVLMEIDGFRVLNINDAGINRRIAGFVAPVDAVASSFSPGASGYPLTWSHLSAPEQSAIMEQARGGAIEMLRGAMDAYGGEYLLPFASHFALWHPEHAGYVRALRRNTLEDVVGAFESTEVRVLDLLPGDRFDVASGVLSRERRPPSDLHDPERVLRDVGARFDPEVFARHHPSPANVPVEDVEAYFLRLNESPEIELCEDLTARVRTPAGEGVEPIEVAFEISGGRLRLLEAPPETANLLIEVPSGILARIVRDNLSWDEAQIGYWCRFHRSPNVYHAGFWRLVQAPYYGRSAEPPPVDRGAITANAIVADLIESYGPHADRVLRRHGLYCAGCEHSTSDSLALGARVHGIEQDELERLVRELNGTFQAMTEQ